MPLSLAIRIKIPWHMTSDALPIQIRALYADRRPVDRNPMFELKPELGRPPGLRPGDEIGVNLAVGLTGFPIKAEGTIYFHLIVAGQELGVLPLKVIRVPIIQIQMAPQG